MTKLIQTGWERVIEELEAKIEALEGILANALGRINYLERHNEQYDIH